MVKYLCFNILKSVLSINDNPVSEINWVSIGFTLKENDDAEAVKNLLSSIAKRTLDNEYASGVCAVSPSNHLFKACGEYVAWEDVLKTRNDQRAK